MFKRLDRKSAMKKKDNVAALAVLQKEIAELNTKNKFQLKYLSMIYTHQTKILDKIDNIEKSQSKFYKEMLKKLNKKSNVKNVPYKPMLAPPPPPPPQILKKFPNNNKINTRFNPMNSIKQGTSLKKVNNIKKTNARTNLMNSIKKGTTLKKVNTIKQNTGPQAFANNPVLARRVALAMNNNNNYNNGNWNN